MATLRMAGPWRHPKTGIYHLRVRIPQRLRAVSGQTGDQFKLSLRTKDVWAAKAAWPGALATWQARQAEWERKLKAVVATPSVAADLAAGWAAWISADLSRLDRAGVPAVVFEEGFSVEAEMARALSGLDSARQAEMATARLRVHAAEAAHLTNIDVTESSAGQLLQALRPVVLAAYRQADIRKLGVTAGEGDHWNPLQAARQTLPAATDPKASAPASSPAAVSLVGLFNGWKATATVKPRTIEETRYHVVLLAKHMGHDDAARIDQAALRGWRDEMLAAGKTNNTFNNRLSMVGVVLAWGVQEGRLPANPATGLRLRKSRAVAPRFPYTDDEAVMILNAARREIRPSLRWAHWVMAFTGMRAGEVLQLTGHDLRQEGDLWFLAVHEDDPTKTVKTGQRRNVPVHPALEAEGFVAYARTIAGDGPLFPDKALDKHGNRGGRAWNVTGKWVRQHVGITDPKKAPDHSWRHRVEDELRAAECPEDARDAIVGHARKTTGRQYGVRGESLARLHRHLAQMKAPAGLVIEGYGEAVERAA